MSKFETFSDLTRRRIANWVLQAKPVKEKETWKEKRLVIDFQGHTYFVSNDQIFQCAHCGHYDPQWSITEVLAFFKLMGIKPREVEVTCTIES